MPQFKFQMDPLPCSSLWLRGFARVVRWRQPCRMFPFHSTRLEAVEGGETLGRLALSGVSPFLSLPIEVIEVRPGFPEPLRRRQACGLKIIHHAAQRFNFPDARDR
jgi:hypothetical protein